MKSDGAQPSTEDHDALEKDGAMEAEEKARSGSSNESEASHTQSLAYGASEAAEEAQRPQIKFSDQVKRSDVMADEHIHMPVHRSTEEYIAFHERQLNRDDSAVLRIPGPRDADAGVAPPAVDESDPAVRTNSRRESAFSHAPDHVERLNGDDHIDSVTPRRNIAIAEPARPPAVEHVAEDATAVKHSLGSLRYRAPRWLGGNKKPHEDENQLHPTKSRLARTPCKHEYCRDCIQGLFQASLTDDTLFPPRCCKQPITFGGGVRIRSFESKLIEFDTPDRTYCSNQLCSAFIRVENILEEKATCPECSTITCTVCKSESHLGDCPADAGLQQVLAAAEEHRWQRCFNCRRVIELEVGCNHITYVLSLYPCKYVYSRSCQVQMRLAILLPLRRKMGDLSMCYMGREPTSCSCKYCRCSSTDCRSATTSRTHSRRSPEFEATTSVRSSELAVREKSSSIRGVS